MEALRLCRRVLKPFIDEEYQTLAAQEESEDIEHETAGVSVVVEKEQSIGGNRRAVDRGIPR